MEMIFETEKVKNKLFIISVLIAVWYKIASVDAPPVGG